MRKIQQQSFALVEANLYLDSHPTCPKGLEYFAKHKKEYDELVAEYNEKYGPITVGQSSTEKKWGWVTTPFPWERGES
jgi:spore coat protein JB